MPVNSNRCAGDQFLITLPMLQLQASEKIRNSNKESDLKAAVQNLKLKVSGGSFCELTTMTTTLCQTIPMRGGSNVKLPNKKRYKNNSQLENLVSYEIFWLNSILQKSM